MGAARGTAPAWRRRRSWNRPAPASGSPRRRCPTARACDKGSPAISRCPVLPRLEDRAELELALLLGHVPLGGVGVVVAGGRRPGRAGLGAFLAERQHR